MNVVCSFICLLFQEMNVANYTIAYHCMDKTANV